MARFLEAYIQYDSRHVLPAGGGWVDQAASFVDAVAIADAERGRMEEGRREGDRGDRVLAEARARTEKYRRQG